MVDATTGDAYTEVSDEDPTWGGAPITFPRIQGADVCGQVVAVGPDADASLVGKRVITDNWLRDWENPENKNSTGYYGSECDGGYAQFTKIDERNVHPVNSTMSDAELATFSCSYSTAEGMLSRANVTAGDRVLITGASGGVGSALIQLAKRRGAYVIAMASVAKHDEVGKLNPDVILPRSPKNLAKALNDATGSDTVSVVDLRTFYLRDLTFTGSTVIPPHIFTDLVGYIERNEIKPMLAAEFPLVDLQNAQQAFIDKLHTGNIVVCP